ncbi:hypothetical protein THASP1DRAFT_31728 [Thamnocephalis sphaerospora]|uniref:Uncharacterized protein n=1 Tax=Thamnocephalis sphaerospora TaxID=78915 RepID=A0A4P9XL13_9FUNG|nr:hypothetical protein THASP1DRAFT_31728 [Thamnocephalis sphaerospora]|eukprot:RKP06456.1 hypothetical protein THASP1DRAFT_31728 [Thamnocephalis sphaerospora]
MEFTSQTGDRWSFEMGYLREQRRKRGSSGVSRSTLEVPIEDDEVTAIWLPNPVSSQSGPPTWIGADTRSTPITLAIEDRMQHVLATLESGSSDCGEPFDSDEDRDALVDDVEVYVVAEPLSAPASGGSPNGMLLALPDVMPYSPNHNSRWL